MTALTWIDKLIMQAQRESEFPVNFDIIYHPTTNRMIGVHFREELHYPYEDHGPASMIAANWRGMIVYIHAPENPSATRAKEMFDTPLAERAAAIIAEIHRLEADYQRSLDELDRSR